MSLSSLHSYLSWVRNGSTLSLASLHRALVASEASRDKVDIHWSLFQEAIRFSFSTKFSQDSYVTLYRMMMTYTIYVTYRVFYHSESKYDEILPRIQKIALDAT